MTHAWVIILLNEMEYLENTEQLRTSSLKRLISMSCIRLDRAHRCWVLHAGTLVACVWKELDVQTRGRELA